MSRRSQAPRRAPLPDPKYGNKMLAKFINMVMLSGKKSVAEQIVYGALDRIAERSGQEGAEALELLGQALDNIKPAVEVKSRRIGGATYQVPIEVPKNRRFYLASQWIINAAVGRSGKPMSEKLASELISAANGEGGAIKKKDDTHRMAEANKAFAHFR